MLFRSQLRLLSKWIKCHNANNQLMPTVSAHLSTGQIAHLHTSDSMQDLSKCCTLHIKSSIFSGLGNAEYCTESVPPLYVGAKVIVNMRITSDMVECFAQATGDWNPIHFDGENSIVLNENYHNRKDETVQKKAIPIVHGALLNGIVSGVIGTRLPGPGTVVISQIFKFTAPLPVGSEVAVKIEVMNFRRREVNVRYNVVSVPEETLVMDGTARLMVPRDRMKKGS